MPAFAPHHMAADVTPCIFTMRSHRCHLEIVAVIPRVDSFPSAESDRALAALIVVGSEVLVSLAVLVLILIPTSKLGFVLYLSRLRLFGCSRCLSQLTVDVPDLISRWQLPHTSCTCGNVATLGALRHTPIGVTRYSYILRDQERQLHDLLFH